MVSVSNLFAASALAAAAVFPFFIALWVWSIQAKDVGVVDIFWGLGFVIMAWTTKVYFHHQLPLASEGWRPFLMRILVTIWGVRLALYLLYRNWGKDEDKRYLAIRQKMGAHRFWWTSLFVVFGVQGLLMYVIAYPIFVVHYYSLQLPETGHASLNSIDCLGLGLWCFGFTFEAVSDLHLAIFKANHANAGRILTTGLWKYTRHPNYFGEFSLWWGYYCLAVATVDGWWCMFSPIIMSILLLQVSGVRLLESDMGTRDGYNEYMATTSPFFPWKPRKRTMEGEGHMNLNQSRLATEHFEILSPGGQNHSDDSHLPDLSHISRQIGQIDVGLPKDGREARSQARDLRIFPSPRQREVVEEPDGIVHD
eukprot:Selendium_serpulae@DN5412_c0_g1_i10.p1